MVEEHWGSELLGVATRASCLPIIDHLLKRARHEEELRDKLVSGCHSIGEAVRGDRTEAHLQFTNDRDKICCTWLLVPLLQDRICKADIYGDTPLMRIIKSYSNSEIRYECVKILISHTNVIGIDHDSDYSNNALRAAVQLGDTEVCQLLLSEGQMEPMSILTPSQDVMFVLKETPEVNEEAVFRLLLRFQLLHRTCRIRFGKVFNLGFPEAGPQPLVRSHVTRLYASRSPPLAPYFRTRTIMPPPRPALSEIDNSINRGKLSLDQRQRICVVSTLCRDGYTPASL